MIFYTKLILIASVLFGESLSKVGENDKFNIVLFLAHSDAETSSCDPTGLKFLKFKEKARVKHCDGGAKSEDAGSVEAHYTGSGSDCASLLKASLYSLISYCRNMIGMTTALACAENNTFTNSLRFQRSAASRRFQRDYQGYNIIKSMPLFYPRARHPAGSKKQFITKPEHTEVFKIRSKRHNHQHQQKKSATVPLNNFKDPNWDFLGVIATIKMTFFGKLIPESPGINKDTSLETNKEIAEIKQSQGDVESKGESKEECLFDLVKDTLSSVQESCESGFLIVVVGGNLSEVADPYSNLVQSVKHITENTDDANTIIVVTGSCPTREHYLDAGALIPVYVKGPPITDIIAQTSELYNIPYAIKNIIADSNVEGNFFTNMRARRNKRNVSSSSNALKVMLYKLLLCMLFMLN